MYYHHHPSDRVTTDPLPHLPNGTTIDHRVENHLERNFFNRTTLTPHLTNLPGPNVGPSALDFFQPPALHPHLYYHHPHPSQVHNPYGAPFPYPLHNPYPGNRSSTRSNTPRDNGVVGDYPHPPSSPNPGLWISPKSGAATNPPLRHIHPPTYPLQSPYFLQPPSPFSRHHFIPPPDTMHYPCVQDPSGSRALSKRKRVRTTPPPSKGKLAKVSVSCVPTLSHDHVSDHVNSAISAVIGAAVRSKGSRGPSSAKAINLTTSTHSGKSNGRYRTPKPNLKIQSKSPPYIPPFSIPTAPTNQPYEPRSSPSWVGRNPSSGYSMATTFSAPPRRSRFHLSTELDELSDMGNGKGSYDYLPRSPWTQMGQSVDVAKPPSVYPYPKPVTHGQQLVNNATTPDRGASFETVLYPGGPWATSLPNLTGMLHDQTHQRIDHNGPEYYQEPTPLRTQPQPHQNPFSLFSGSEEPLNLCRDTLPHQFRERSSGFVPNDGTTYPSTYVSNQSLDLSHTKRPSGNDISDAQPSPQFARLDGGVDGPPLFTNNDGPPSVTKVPYDDNVTSCPPGEVDEYDVCRQPNCHQCRITKSPSSFATDQDYERFRYQRTFPYLPAPNTPHTTTANRMSSPNCTLGDRLPTNPIPYFDRSNASLQHDDDRQFVKYGSVSESTHVLQSRPKSQSIGERDLALASLNYFTGSIATTPNTNINGRLKTSNSSHLVSDIVPANYGTERFGRSSPELFHREEDFTNRRFAPTNASQSSFPSPPHPNVTEAPVPSPPTNEIRRTPLPNYTAPDRPHDRYGLLGCSSSNGNARPYYQDTIINSSEYRTENCEEEDEDDDDVTGQRYRSHSSASSHLSDRVRLFPVTVVPAEESTIDRRNQATTAPSSYVKVCPAQMVNDITTRHSSNIKDATQPGKTNSILSGPKFRNHIKHSIFNSNLLKSGTTNNNMPQQSSHNTNKPANISTVFSFTEYSGSEEDESSHEFTQLENPSKSALYTNSGKRFYQDYSKPTIMVHFPLYLLIPLSPCYMDTPPSGSRENSVSVEGPVESILGPQTTSGKYGIHGSYKKAKIPEEVSQSCDGNSNGEIVSGDQRFRQTPDDDFSRSLVSKIVRYSSANFLHNKKGLSFLSQGLSEHRKTPHSKSSHNLAYRRRLFNNYSSLSDASHKSVHSSACETNSPHVNSRACDKRGAHPDALVPVECCYESSQTHYPNTLPSELKRIVPNKASGETILHTAARRNLKDSCLYLIHSNEYNVNQKENAGYTPLQEACLAGSKEAVRILLAHGADPNCSLPDGTRPLHDAIEMDDVSMVKLLLSFGADPTLKTYVGKSCLNYGKSVKMKTFLKKYIALYFNSAVPKAFLDDVTVTEDNVFSEKRDLLDTLPSFDDRLDTTHNNITFEISDKPLIKSHNIQHKGKQINVLLLDDISLALGYGNDYGALIETTPELKEFVLTHESQNMYIRLMSPLRKILNISTDVLEIDLS